MREKDSDRNSLDLVKDISWILMVDRRGRRELGRQEVSGGEKERRFKNVTERDTKQTYEERE